MVVAATPLFGIVYAVQSRGVSLELSCMGMESGQKSARGAGVDTRSKYEATCFEIAASSSSMISNTLNGAVAKLRITVRCYLTLVVRW